MKYIRDIFDMIFSFGTFIFLMAVGFVYVIIQVGEADDRKRELHQKHTAYCYSQNMILIETDAGRYCAPASSLAVVK